MTMSWQLEAEAAAGRGGTARRWRLSNGLGLIAAIDRRAPIVALQTWFRVGSRHERPGAAGMAHLFEHQMFGQPATLPAGCPPARLHRRLVIQDESASSVDAQLTPFRDPSLLRLAVTCARGHNADEILQTIDRALASLIEKPPAAAEDEKEKALAETDFWSALVDVDGKAEALGHYETALGDFRKLDAIAKRLTAVTADDVARVVRTYLVPAIT